MAIALTVAALTSSAAAQGELNLELELVTEGLTAPVALATPPDDDRRFVVEQTGVILILGDDGAPLETPFLDVRDRLVEFRSGFDERGLLSVAFHPDYAENGRFFVYYSAPLHANSLAALNHTAHVSEFHVSDADPNRADPESERVVLALDEPAFNHNGGKVAFGPDGYLYIAFGDGGNANDVGPFHPPMGNGQDVTTLLGTILRIDVDGDDGRGYAVPSDNPFVGGVELPEDYEWSGLASNQGARDEIYIWGARNPFRFSFDRANGDLWIGDVGQGYMEEHNRVTGPGNLGWRIMEGTTYFNLESNREPLAEGPTTGPMGEELVLPVLTYLHMGTELDGARGISTTGGYVYRGSAIPELEGHYVFGDWSESFAAPTGKLFAAAEQSDDSWEFVLDQDLGVFVLAFGEDADGELYVLTTGGNAPQGDTGRVWKIVSGN
ncbi:MAG: sorbosone dehydrogenase family protein [Trueperaceae bacterium]